MSNFINKVITFAIPCYNSAEYMDNCIEHLLKLNSVKDDIEILIIDDGSSMDNTLEIAKTWEKKFPNTIRAIHQENGGHGQAVNTGLKNANGLYFKVVDSDDWLDFDGTKPIMDYIRKQAKGDASKATDLVIGNYVYNKVHENSMTPINYKDALPEDREFTWDDIKKFKISEYLLMHSAIYRTHLLRDIKLELPKHTFYVDNIFVYVPLPHVKTMYYINSDMYMYYIGREDQSVNEEVMKSRIDQQLKITRIMIDSTNLPELNKMPNLKRYMLNYLAMMMCICTVFLRMIGTKDAEEKRRQIWEYLKAHDEKLSHKIMQSPLCYGTNIPGEAGKLIGTTGYKIAQKLFGFN